jgi:holo-[acyl-carrier protein] synthase
MADSVGIDIVELARIKSSVERFGERFLKRILGPDEQAVYRRRVDSTAFLAGRFAAKEATIKALGMYLTRRPPLSNIQIVNDTGGQPRVRFSDELAAHLSGTAFLVSISHDRNYAIAVTIGTRKR